MTAKQPTACLAAADRRQALPVRKRDRALIEIDSYPVKTALNLLLQDKTTKQKKSSLHTLAQEALSMLI